MADDNGGKPANGNVSENAPADAIETDTPVATKSNEIEDKPTSEKARDFVSAITPSKLSDEPVNNGEVEATNVSEAEGQVKKLPYPKSVFFIISNEFCERFNYYGMRTILVLYLSRQLDYSDDTATVIFHIFTMFVYFLCILGAIISDSWLGKFKTILYLSLVYVCGSVLITLGAIPPLNLPATTFTMLGLSLIALGSGGIKPCVSAFGGDQFKMPEQIKQMTTFFSLFYFSINAGSLISTTVTPILREDVACFGEKECYSLAFGVPAVLMAVSIVIFVLGRPLYKSKPPAGNMVVLVSKTIGNAISTKWKEKKTNPREHWLDYADKKYDRQLIEDVKVLMRVLVLYLPLPIFWALFDQQGSRWTFQATRMDGDMGSWDIKPDQLQVLNPLLILVFIPLYDVAFYPALSLIGIRRPLQKLTMGGILAGVAFIISGVVELELEKTYPITPSAGYIQLRIFNGIPDCSYTINSNLTGFEEIPINGFGKEFEHFIHLENTSVSVFYTIKEQKDCPKLSGGVYEFKEKTAYSIFLKDKINAQVPFIYREQMEKPSRANPLVRNLANIDADTDIVWKSHKSGDVESSKKADDRKIMELRATNYDVLVDNVEMQEAQLRHGGVYALIVGVANNGSTLTKLEEVIPPNSMNILWLVPQYVVMTLGEVMFSVTGLEFSYSQAPLAMKSVLQACWLLTVAFGNVIVVIVAEAKIFKSQASEFFLFAGLMFADMIVFMWVAYRYKPNNPILSESTQNLIDDQPETSKDASIAKNNNYDFQQREQQKQRVPRYTKRQQVD
ncbi:peptide transporter family 1 isoform X1 [Stomoxys calcitrans]|uniref:peptide transporter family 1 isoform X1 n=1 Tax=Stomoxys calcitrans TaxID=35570 RepID=UPI0027E37E8A|nr:peptide transporter family 1 isoform X1 [Stomoxys calcitrans]